MNLNIAPVIFLNFNRPDKTKKSLEAIRSVKPTKIFIFADGPRPNSKSDRQLCLEVRSLLKSGIDWPCDAVAAFPEENLGCGKGVASAISTAFNIYESAIVLEDDCIPNESFFLFCSTMLQRYSDSETIGAINGSNYQDFQRRGDGDYYFSNYFHTWGWATWRRVWSKYDYKISRWPDFKKSLSWMQSKGSPEELEYWTWIFEREFKSDKNDAWDYQFSACLWMHKYLSITPNKNLVRNIGFNSDSTHTIMNTRNLEIETSALDSFKAPSSVTVNRIADQYTYWRNFSESPYRSIILEVLRNIC